MQKDLGQDSAFLELAKKGYTVTGMVAIDCLLTDLEEELKQWSPFNLQETLIDYGVLPQPKIKPQEAWEVVKSLRSGLTPIAYNLLRYMIYLHRQGKWYFEKPKRSADRFECSRRTIYRALRQLIDFKLIEKCEHWQRKGWRLTTLGLLTIPKPRKKRIKSVPEQRAELNESLSYRVPTIEEAFENRQRELAEWRAKRTTKAEPSPVLTLGQRFNQKKEKSAKIFTLIDKELKAKAEAEIKRIRALQKLGGGY